MGTYAQAAMTTWKNADFPIGKMAALAEIVNLPQDFVYALVSLPRPRLAGLTRPACWTSRCRKPYLVVNQTDWIQCRYLIVQRNAAFTENASTNEETPDAVVASLRTIPLDPAFRLTLSDTPLQIPDVLDKLEKMEAQLDDVEEALNDSDAEIMREPTLVIEESPMAGSASRGSRPKRSNSSAVNSPSKSKQKRIETFTPCDDARLELVKLLPPPRTPNRSATIAIQREMKAMVEQQDKEGPIEAGFYFDPVRHSCATLCHPARLTQV